jgi:CheY-like chemotaxis protein
VATILLVEDDPLVRLILQEDLIDCGYLVVGVPDATGAIEKLTSGELFDVVLTDVNLPGSMDGIGLARWMTDNAPMVLTLVMSGRHEAKAQVDLLCKNATFFRRRSSPRTSTGISSLYARYSSNHQIRPTVKDCGLMCAAHGLWRGVG